YVIIATQTAHPPNNKLRPVISGGFSMPSNSNIVGATSSSEPPSRKVPLNWGSQRMNGTGLVVWAVCGPPPAGSIICSQLPWSEVMTATPLTGSIVPTTQPGPGAGDSPASAGAF